MLFAAPPSLLSSVDLISMADDPFSSQLEATGRDGWSQAGPAPRQCAPTAVEKPVLAAWRVHVPNWSLASYRGKNALGARSQVFLGKEGGCWKPDCTNPLNSNSSGLKTPSAKFNCCWCYVPGVMRGTFLVSLLVFTGAL